MEQVMSFNLMNLIPSNCFTLIFLTTYFIYIFNKFLYSINNLNRFFNLHKVKQFQEYPLHPKLFLQIHFPKKLYTRTLFFYIQVLGFPIIQEV